MVKLVIAIEQVQCYVLCSVTWQPPFGDAITGIAAKWPLRNKRRNSILVTCHYPDMSSTSDSLRTADAFPDAASLRRRYFSEGEKRRPEMRLLFAGYTSDWLKQISLVVRPIRDTTQTWLVTRHQSGISALVPWTSFRGETSDGVAKCRLFSQPL